jgi:hypothetical protein
MFKSISVLVSTSKTLTFSAALVAAVAPALVLGCGSSSGESPAGTGTVGATATAYNRSTHALSAAAGLNFINGTYNGCAGHSNTDLWNVPFPEAMGSPTNPVALSVALNDIHCSLAITSLDADQNYTTSALALTGNFTTPSPFVFTSAANGSSVGNLAFYGNTDMSPGNFSAGFAISFVYSDDPMATTGGRQAIFAQVTSTAGSTQVVAPDYTADLTGVTISTDANNIVQGEVGNVTFPNGTNNRLGETYVIHQGALADGTFATADTAFAADAATMGGAGTVGTPTTLGAATFVQDGNDLTNNKIVTVIFRNIANRVSAYEAIAITFTPPTP